MTWKLENVQFSWFLMNTNVFVFKTCFSSKLHKEKNKSKLVLKRKMFLLASFFGYQKITFYSRSEMDEEGDFSMKKSVGQKNELRQKNVKYLKFLFWIDEKCWHIFNRIKNSSFSSATFWFFFFSEKCTFFFFNGSKIISEKT